MTTIDLDLVAQRAEDAIELQADFRGLIADAQAEEAGHVVRYAVDQSEIYSYVFPESTALPLRIFSDDPDERIVAVQHYVLNKLFHELSYPVVMLPPYIRELQQFATKLRSRAFEGTIGLLPEIMIAARDVVHSPQFEQLEADVESMRGVEHPDQRTLNRALAFFQQKAASLLQLIDGTDTEPFARLSDLLEQERLLPLGALVPAGLEPDADVTHSWLERLATERPTRSGANENDAQAMGYLVAANKWAEREGKPVMIRLVTRSPHMLLIDREHANAHDSGNGGQSVLRHPRAFVALRRMEGRPDQSTFERLKIMQESLAVMSKAVEVSPLGERVGAAQSAPVDTGVSGPDGQAAPTQPENSVIPSRDRGAAEQRSDQEANKLISGIEEQLDDGAGLASVGVVSRNSPRKRIKTPDIDRTRVITLLEAIRDEKYLLREIGTKVRILADKVDEKQQLMPVPVLVAPELVMETTNGRTVLGSRLYWMPYKLVFTDPELDGWLKHLMASQPTSMSGLLDRLQDGFDRGLNYEVPLALANVFGAMDQWEIARSYCDLALLQASLKPEPSHEAKFFKGMCLRMLPASGQPVSVVAERYGEAVALIDDAAAMTTRPGTPVQARYLIEKMTVLFRWSRLEWRTNSEVAKARERQALVVAQEVLGSAQPDRMERAHIYNNLCFHYLETDDARRVTQIRTCLRRLEKLIDPRKLREWPPNFQDTVLLAYCRLKDQPIDRQYLQNLYDALSAALEKPVRGVRPLDRERVENHLAEAAGVLRLAA